MDEAEILAEFRAAEALLEGHFILSSGLHSPRYLQCARMLMDPVRASRLASALVDRSNGEADLGVPFYPLVRLNVPAYAEDAPPPECAALPAQKPGSRRAA